MKYNKNIVFSLERMATSVVSAGDLASLFSPVRARVVPTVHAIAAASRIPDQAQSRAIGRSASDGIERSVPVGAFDARDTIADALRAIGMDRSASVDKWLARSPGCVADGRLRLFYERQGAVGPGAPVSDVSPDGMTPASPSASRTKIRSTYADATMPEFTGDDQAGGPIRVAIGDPFAGRHGRGRAGQDFIALTGVGHAQIVKPREPRTGLRA